MFSREKDSPQRHKVIYEHKEEKVGGEKFQHKGTKKRKARVTKKNKGRKLINIICIIFIIVNSSQGPDR
jgi:hypothetical protein